MKFIVAIEPGTESTALGVAVPDLPGCFSAGDTMDEAMLRRRESLRTWAKRMGVSVATLQRLEAGDPSVSVGIVATALWIKGCDGALCDLAAPEHDHGALELDIRAAVQLGRERAVASAEARLRAQKNAQADQAPDELYPDQTD